MPNVSNSTPVYTLCVHRTYCHKLAESTQKIRYALCCLLYSLLTAPFAFSKVQRCRIDLQSIKYEISYLRKSCASANGEIAAKRIDFSVFLVVY